MRYTPSALPAETIDFMKLNLNNITLNVAGTEKQFPAAELPQFAFSGRSNVGKSTLINTLLGRKKLARTSASPGKTITVNFYEIDRKLFFVDLPGYGYAKRTLQDKQRWSKLVDGYLTRESQKICRVLQLIDLKVGLTADDEMMLQWLAHTGIPYIVVATKADKLNKTMREENLRILKESGKINPGAAVIPFSALDGSGKDDVWRELYASLDGGK